MELFANKLLIFILVMFTSAQNENTNEKPFDNEESDSQNSYRFINLPVKDVKFGSLFRDDSSVGYKFNPNFKIPPPFNTVPSKPKKMSVFNPDPKFVGYMNFRLASMGSKNPYSKYTAQKKFQHIYKPVHPNFHSDLEIIKIPLSNTEKERYDLHSITNPDPSEFKANFELQDVPNLYPLQREFLESASQKQIEKFYEDQQKQIDKKVELQLLNDPNPAAKGQYHQFLKAKEDEKIEKEYEEDLLKKDQRRGTSYAPVEVEERQLLKKSITPGLSHFRTARFGFGPESSYAFEVQL